MKYFAILLACATLFLACKSGDRSSASETSSGTEELNTGNKYALTKFSPSTAFPDASIESMDFSAGVFRFSIGGDSYKLGVQTPDAPRKNCANSAEGQHIHLIVDDQPYAAKYTAEFEYNIPDGEHYLLAFLSRSYHESIKTDAAHVASKVTIKDNSISELNEIEGPMLFYSRPKGAYTGDDTKRVMLDYYLVNADPDQYRVRADINGEVHDLSDWVPYYIDGLPAGENKITLTLLDKSGNKVDAPLNPVTRTIQLTPDPRVNQ